MLLARLYWFHDKNNLYFLNYIYENFIGPEFVFYFKKIDKIWFLIFLQYAYPIYFSENVDQGLKYIKFSFETKD